MCSSIWAARLLQHAPGRDICPGKHNRAVHRSHVCLWPALTDQVSRRSWVWVLHRVRLAPRGYGASAGREPPAPWLHRFNTRSPEGGCCPSIIRDTCTASLMSGRSVPTLRAGMSISTALGAPGLHAAKNELTPGLAPSAPADGEGCEMRVGPECHISRRRNLAGAPGGVTGAKSRSAPWGADEGHDRRSVTGAAPRRHRPRPKGTGLAANISGLCGGGCACPASGLCCFSGVLARMDIKRYCCRQRVGR